MSPIPSSTAVHECAPPRSTRTFKSTSKSALPHAALHSTPSLSPSHPLTVGTSHPELAQLIAKRLGIPLARANVVQPPSGETKVTIVESVRDYDVYILNTVSRKRPTCANARRAPAPSTPRSWSSAS